MSKQTLILVSTAYFLVNGAVQSSNILLLVLQISQERGTASGIFQAALNLCNAIGPVLGGVIAMHWGYRVVMFFAAALGIGGLMAALAKTGDRLMAGELGRREERG